MLTARKLTKVGIAVIALTAGVTFGAIAPASAGPGPLTRADSVQLTHYGPDLFRPVIFDICERFPWICDGVEEPKIPEVGPQCLSCPFELENVKFDDLLVQPEVEAGVLAERGGYAIGG